MQVNKGPDQSQLRTRPQQAQAPVQVVAPSQDLESQAPEFELASLAEVDQEVQGDTEWPYLSFTKAQSEQWKSQFGAIECKEINGVEYVYRGLRRGEHSVLIPDSFTGTQEVEEEKTVAHALLSPVLSEHQIADLQSGLASNLFQEVTRLSGFLPPNVAYMADEFFIFEGKTPKDIMAEAENLINNVWPNMFRDTSKLPGLDHFSKWVARCMPMSWSVLEEKLFIQIAQTRRSFKRYRETLKAEAATISRGQELLASETVVWPSVQDFHPSSDDLLSGTIKQLADRAMIIASFSSASAPVRL